MSAVAWFFAGLVCAEVVLLVVLGLCAMASDDPRRELGRLTAIEAAAREYEEAEREYLYGDEMLGDDFEARSRVLARAARAASEFRSALYPERRPW